MVVDLATAKLHLRVGGASEDALITMWMGAAERYASQYLNRNVYPDANTLADALTTVPEGLEAAQVAYDAAAEAAYQLPAGAQRDAAMLAACLNLADAKEAARMVISGIVINDLIKAGMLLILGHLYENRQEVQAGAAVQIPMGATALLTPDRVGWGV